ncbi:ParB/RepB/Spo0J family partition protein [Kitasatospora sp. NPDC059577]|uniref:ParB/RepB/Spo0J family partition protein n=1 Tax=Kitasatospora sp. NPDC059577 TaxID=3346873 RepID=UPI0036B63156
MKQETVSDRAEPPLTPRPGRPSPTPRTSRTPPEAGGSAPEPGRPPQEWSPALSEVVPVPVVALLPADSPRTGGEDPEHLRTLAGLDQDLPPIIVHRPSMRVIDGMHRLRVAAAQGRPVIPARFFEGSERDAFVLSVQSNTRHGLPLSRADRVGAARRILTSHAEWSDRMVASVTGLSTKAVRELRRSESGTIPHAAARVGRDGRVRPLDSALGRLRAGELITANPLASLRAVADEAGISPGTVRDVRDRLRRGEDPVPAGRRTTRPADRARPDRTRPAPPAVGPAPGARQAGPGPQQPAQDLARVMERLMSDPALRLTESGRHLLRMLTSSLLPPDQRDQLARSIPPHCADRVSRLALECAAAWREFAHQVETARPEQDPGRGAEQPTSPQPVTGRAGVPAAV